MCNTGRDRNRDGEGSPKAVHPSCSLLKARVTYRVWEMSSLPSLQPDGQKGAGPRIAPEEKQKCAPSKNKQGAGITVSKEWEAHDWWLQS